MEHPVRRQSDRVLFFIAARSARSASLSVRPSEIDATFLVRRDHVYANNEVAQNKKVAPVLPLHWRQLSLLC